VTGVVVPRDAVVRGLNGQPQVLVHNAPERFAPTPVTVVPLDAARALITAGLAPNSRVVVQGAALLNQIR
jgi:membrane fusion protein, heavy metal efflux system